MSDTDTEQPAPAQPGDETLFDLGDGGGGGVTNPDAAQTPPAPSPPVCRRPGRPRKNPPDAPAFVEAAATKKRGPYRKRLGAVLGLKGGEETSRKNRRKKPGEDLLRRERLQLVAAVEAMQRAQEKHEMLMAESEESPSVTLAYTSLVTDLLAEFHKGVLAEFDRKFGRYTVGGAAKALSPPQDK